ncbi:MAG: DUF695 domain-containing protein [Planctomycetaceae bacterium]
MEQYQQMTEKQWILAQGVVNEIPILVRCISPMDPVMIVPDLGLLIIIYWEYDGDASGFPTAVEKSLMDTFETRLNTSLREDQSGLMVGVQTINGRQTYVFYARDIELFQEHVIQITDDLEKPYPIQIEFQEDPTWGFFFEHVYVEPNEGEQ